MVRTHLISGFTVRNIFVIAVYMKVIIIALSAVVLYR